MNPRLFLQLEQKHLDGLGAQTHRAISLLAIASFLNVQCEIGNLQQRAQGVLIPEYTSDELESWNRLLTLTIRGVKRKSWTRDFNNCWTIKPKRLWLALVITFVLTTVLPIRIKLLIEDPHSITNRFPFFLEKLRKKIQIGDLIPLQASFRIVVHLRQGDILLPQFAYRQMSLLDYEETLSKIKQVISNHGLSSCEILLVSNPSSFKLNEVTTADLQKQDYDVLTLQGTIFHGEVDFSSLTPVINETEHPNLFFSTRYMNTDSFQDLLTLISADILIMSKSSFSYVAAFMNRTGIIICPDFWHPRLSDWIDPKSVDFQDYLLRKLSKLSNLRGRAARGN